MQSYQDIYNAASDLDEGRFSATQWVDYRNGIWTAASKLAYEQQDEAVALLLNHGADPRMIAEGYARAGSHAMVEAYRSKYPACTDGIARGYAWAGDHAKVEKYRTEYAARAEYIAEGYAMIGDHVNVEVYRLRHHVSPDDIARAYAQVGDVEHVEIYAHLGAKQNKIVEGFALVSDHQRVQDYSGDSSYFPSMIIGYALAGAHAKIEEYRVQDPSLVNWIARCYAQANNHEKVEEYRARHGASLDTIATGYALVSNHEKVIEVFMRKIIQEIAELNGSWFYDNSARIQVLQDLHRNLVSPSQKDKTLGSLLRRLDIPFAGLGIDRHSYFDAVSLHAPKPVHAEQKKYKETLQQERRKEDPSSASIEKNTHTDSESQSSTESLGLRSRKRE